MSFRLPTYRDDAYLDHVRGRACAICSAPPPSDPHHFGPGGTALKTDDRRTVPLCRRCHDAYHNERAIPPYSKAETERELYRAQVDSLLAYSAAIG